MWTNPAYRRRGLAGRVLDALEDAAATGGYHRLVLETGSRQPEPVAMYERRGYAAVPPFGPYPEAVAFEARLDPSARRHRGAGCPSHSRPEA